MFPKVVVLYEFFKVSVRKDYACSKRIKRQNVVKTKLKNNYFFCPLPGIFQYKCSF